MQTVIKWKKPIICFLAVLLLATAGLSVVRAKMNDIGDETILGPVETRLIDEASSFLDVNSPFYEAYRDSDRVNILLLGVNDGMTDTIMVVSYDIENQDVDLISVPRDTYYYRDGVKGDGMFKINAVYHTSGKDSEGKNRDVLAAAKAVSQTLLGIPIHYWVTISYQNIIDIVDAMGGVPYNVPQDMDYDDNAAKPALHIHIKAGQQVLDGETAVKFLRFRSGYRKGDIGRIEAQQAFMKAAFKQLMKSNLKEVVNAATASLAGCSDIDWNFLFKVMNTITNFSGENITSYLMPHTLLSVPPYYVYPNVREIASVIAEIYAVPEPEIALPPSEENTAAN